MAHKLELQGTKSRVMPHPQIYNYVLEKGLRLNPIMIDLINVTQKHPDRQFQCSPDQVEFFRMLMHLTHAKKGIEIGTFTGLSALAFALGLPNDGKLVCLDISDEYTKIGKPYWEKAQVAHKIDLRIAPALDSLQKMLETDKFSYDFAFVDADKQNQLKYYEHLLMLVKKGGFIIIDNTLWEGLVAEKTEEGKKVACKELLDRQGQLKEGTEAYQKRLQYYLDTTMCIQELNDFILHDKRVEMVLLPMSDGISLIRII